MLCVYTLSKKYPRLESLFTNRTRQRRTFLAICFCLFFPVAGQLCAAVAETYYLAPASNGGNDANNGRSTSSPWLTPKHSVSCGDVILASASSSYNPKSFDSGNWGTVTCASGNNVAWLKCQTFDACKIQSTSQGIYVDRSYWGVQGWEVTVSGGTSGFCFGTAPNYSNPSQIHHVIFANNIANRCQGGGFVIFNMGSVGVDYVTMVGNIAYNAIQGSAQCYNGISIYQPVQSDSASGTHIYVAGNFAWNNIQHNPCGGVQAYGGDGIIFDTFDGSQGATKPYLGQAVADNNLVIGNGGYGLEVQNNVAGSAHAPIYLRRNTSWGNETDTSQGLNRLCAEVLINSGYNIQELYNLAATNSANACANNPVFAFSAYTINSTVWVYNNLAFGYNGQNTYSYNGGSFQYDSNNVVGQNPQFAAAVIPPAPACNGTGSVPNCMATVVSGFTPRLRAAAGTGYHKPSSTQAYDALFPRWVCKVNLPAGLVTMGC